MKKLDQITGVDLFGQIPLLEKVGPHWFLWLAYSPSRSQGTYLRLLGDGAIWRETLHADGSLTTVVIKPKNKS